MSQTRAGVISVRLNPEQEEIVRKVADFNGETLSAFSKKAIMEFVEDFEDYYDGVSAYNKWVQDGKETLTSGELREQLWDK